MFRRYSRPSAHVGDGVTWPVTPSRSHTTWPFVSNAVIDPFALATQMGEPPGPGITSGDDHDAPRVRSRSHIVFPVAPSRESTLPSCWVSNCTNTIPFDTT